jgi:hypothetical protein
LTSSTSAGGRGLGDDVRYDDRTVQCKAMQGQHTPLVRPSVIYLGPRQQASSALQQLMVGWLPASGPEVWC